MFNVIALIINIIFCGLSFKETLNSVEDFRQVSASLNDLPEKNRIEHLCQTTIYRGFMLVILYLSWVLYFAFNLVIG